MSYSFDIRLPARLEPGRKYPAIFTLHGKGSNEQDLLQLVNPLADSFIQVGIRGNLPAGPGYQYYELVSLGNPIREMFDQALEQLETFMEEASERYPIDNNRRYVLGFSQGAILSMSLAHTMGEKLKGIVALNGYVPEFVKQEHPQPNLSRTSIFISHGEHDTVFPIRIGHETASYLKTFTSNLTFRTYPTGHGVSEENQGDLLEWLHQDAYAHPTKKKE